jgi:hypothetical protein
MGRSKLPPGVAKTYRYVLYVDKKESQRIDRAAKANGFPVPIRWIRDIVMAQANADGAK